MRSRRRTIPGPIAALLSAIVCLPSPSYGGSPETIECGEVVESTLDPGDTDLGDGTWLESYEFTLDALSSVSALMTTAGFQPYVLITDDELVTEYEGEPPLAVFLPPGTFRLFANNLAVLPSGEYPYALSLSCSTREAETIRCGQTVAGHFDPTDDRFDLDTWIDPFDFTVDEPTRVRFRLEAETFDPVVIVRDLDDASLGSGSGEFRIDLDPGEYVVLANNFLRLADDIYPYRLSMFCEAAPCHGDCDGDGQVSIAELIRGVRLALGGTDQACTAFDTNGSGAVSVSELVAAVRAALDGCLGSP